MGDATNSAVPSYLVWIGVAIAIVLRFGFRELRERKIRLGRLFVVPAIVGGVAIVLIVAAATEAPQRVLELAALSVVAGVVGYGIGLAVAHYTTLRVGVEPGIVFIRGSYATLGIWIAAFALRGLARFVVGTHDLGATAIANAALLVVLATAIAVVRYRILIEARIARARGITTELNAI